MRRPFLVALLIAACSSQHTGSVNPQDAFAIVVINHHWLDVRVYVEHDGQRSRVGTVTATSTEQFNLSTRLLGSSRQVTLIGEAIGSREVVRTEALLVRPGEYIEWTLENSLRRSSVAVY